MDKRLERAEQLVDQAVVLVEAVRDELVDKLDKLDPDDEPEERKELGERVDDLSDLIDALNDISFPHGE